MDKLREIEYVGYKLKSITLISQKVLIYGTVQGRAMLGCDYWGCIPLGLGRPTGLGGELSLDGIRCMCLS